MITLDKIFCFVGNLGTATTMATLPLMEQKGVPMLFPNAFKESLYNPPRPNVFCLYPSYIEQARAIATFFVKQKNSKKMGLLYQDDELGEELLRGLEERLGSYGLKLAAAESYKRGATDFSSQIARLRKADLDVLVIGSPPRESVAALKEMRKLSWEVMTSLCGASGGSFYVYALAQESGFSVDGTYTILNRCDYTMPDAPASLKEWVKRYQEWFGMTPEVTVTAGYEPIHFFAVAAEHAGKELNRKKLVEALEGFKEVPSPLCGPPMTFTPQSRLGSKAYFIAQYQGGKFFQVSEYIH
jgi:branched-chain amino acid transport system substrate-binding protein